VSDPRVFPVPFAILDQLEEIIQSCEAARKAILDAYKNERFDGPLPVHEAREKRDQLETELNQKVAQILRGSLAAEYLKGAKPNAVYHPEKWE